MRPKACLSLSERRAVYHNSVAQATILSPFDGEHPAIIIKLHMDESQDADRFARSPNNATKPSRRLPFG
jgi:hypothetical protein